VGADCRRVRANFLVPAVPSLRFLRNRRAGKGALGIAAVHGHLRPFFASVLATARPMRGVPPHTERDAVLQPRFTRAPHASADLQLGHLRVGIEHGVGEQIGRRFAVVERHEHLPARDAIANARGR